MNKKLLADSLFLKELIKKLECKPRSNKSSKTDKSKKLQCQYFALSLIFGALFTTDAFACGCFFDSSQLPMSTELKRTFPALKSASFIIMSEDTKIVLHEENSKNLIDIVGTASQTLYDLCLNCSNFTDSDKIYSFKSKLAGIGCVFKHKTKSNCNFFCAIYGSNSEEDLYRDIKLIKLWLEQFFLFKVSEKDEIVANIPVLYSLAKMFPIKFQDDNFVLISKKCSKNVIKTVRYKTILKAPIRENTNVGTSFYKTSTFDNFIQKPILIKDRIDKGSRWSAIMDSIHYIIFGTPFGAPKQIIEE